MLPDRVSNPGPLTYESGALPIALRGPAAGSMMSVHALCSAYVKLTLRCNTVMNVHYCLVLIAIQFQNYLQYNFKITCQCFVEGYSVQ